MTALDINRTVAVVGSGRRYNTPMSQAVPECPACGVAPHALFQRIGPAEIQVCQRCGLGRTVPTPTLATAAVIRLLRRGRCCGCGGFGGLRSFGCFF